MPVRKGMIAAMTRRDDPKAIEFDRDFWRMAGHEARFAAAWEMVEEVHYFRGEAGADQQRLQRSVQNIQRRRG
jgi:hypothetical protein